MITTEQIDGKIKMPISLKFAVGLLFFRIAIIMVLVTLQSIFLANPPTSGAALGVWQGLQASLGANAKDPGYILGYSLASLSLTLPVLPATFRRSKRWLKAARICIVVELLSNLGRVSIPGIFGDIVMIFVLFSKGATKYVAQDIVSKDDVAKDDAAKLS